MTSVAPDYVHRDKICAPGEPISAGGARLKWYAIAYPEITIDPRVVSIARSFTTTLDVPGDLGFAILHRCGGPGFHFLLVCTWRNENELWESVYAKHDDTDPAFALFPLPGTHRGTFCVWELGVVQHEQQAWRRFLLSARDHAASQDYLHDVHTGCV